MGMNIKKILDNFKSSGFVNIGPVLSSKEILELSKLSKKAFEHARDKSQGRINYRNYIAKDSGVEGLMYLPQHDVIIAQLIDKTLRSKSVASVLKNVLGHSYKIWQINLRRSSPNDRGLYIHQDSPGETNICILLSSNKTGSGATVFLEGSHLVKNTMKKWKIELPPILLRWLSFLFTPITGDAGDVVFFFNRTWHGRKRNKSLRSYDAIFISFFPAGGIFGFDGYGFWAPKFLKSIKGTLLGRLIDPLIGTEILTGGQYKVINQKINPPTVLPYALKIHNKDYFEDSYGTKIKLTVKITLLRLLFFFVRPFYYLIKNRR